MKVEINKAELSPNYIFPRLMKGKGEDKALIVLFTSPECGICLTEWSIYSEGEFRKDWFIDNFDAFYGSVTLSND